VESAVIRLVRRPVPRAAPVSPSHFDALVKGAYTRRRKQIQRVLQEMGEAPRGMACATHDWLHSIGIDPAARPETLSVEQWGRSRMRSQQRTETGKPGTSLILTFSAPARTLASPRSGCGVRRCRSPDPRNRADPQQRGGGAARRHGSAGRNRPRFRVQAIAPA
jgi:hypothetical protein